MKFISNKSQQPEFNTQQQKTSEDFTEIEKFLPKSSNTNLDKHHIGDSSCEFSSEDNNHFRQKLFLYSSKKRLQNCKTYEKSIYNVIYSNSNQSAYRYAYVFKPNLISIQTYIQAPRSQIWKMKILLYFFQISKITNWRKNKIGFYICSPSTSGVIWNFITSYIQVK